MKPSEAFESFLARAPTLVERHTPLDDFEARLWSIAAFDWWHQSGESAQLLDAGGLPVAEAALYAKPINQAVNTFRSVFHENGTACPPTP